MSHYRKYFNRELGKQIRRLPPTWQTTGSVAEQRFILNIHHSRDTEFKGMTSGIVIPLILKRLARIVERYTSEYQQLDQPMSSMPLPRHQLLSEDE